MVNRRLLVVFLTVLAILATAVLPLMTGCAEPAPAPAPAPGPAPAPAPAPPPEKIELRWTAGEQGISETSVPGRTCLSWKADVEQATGGRVKINILTGAAPSPEIFDVVAKGAGDIGFNPIMFNTGRFPTLEAMTVPDMGTVCRHPSRVALDLWRAFPEQIDKEFYEVKLVGLFAATQSPPGIAFATANKPVRKLEDFKGLKVGIYGEWGTKTITALGGVPVAVPPPAVYESVQRGIVDGSFMDPEMLEAQAIYEVVKYWHYLTQMFVPFFLVVNLNTWNSLPDDIQKIMLDKATLLPDRCDADFRESTVRALNDGVNEHGMEIIEYSPEELVRWQELQQPVQDEYIKLLDSKGVDGKKVLDTLNSLYAKYAEW